MKLLLAEMREPLLRRIDNEWFRFARAAQYPLVEPPGTWLVVGGRGSGKTRLGAEWVHSLVNGYPPFARREFKRIALVGETLGDVREVMIEGLSGIAAITRGSRPRYEPTRRRIVWESGAVGYIFSSEDPDSLRGPQFEAAWCDEVAKWKHAEACFDMLQFGLRIGDGPRQLLTTTPKPIPLIRHLLKDEDVKVTRMRTRDNIAQLPASFLQAVEKRYGGTRLGRQELDGELVEEREDALWTRSMIEAARALPAAPRGRVVVAVDPPASSRRSSDACGIIVACREGEDRAAVLADGSLAQAKPSEWTSRAVALFHHFSGDCIVAETNQGGEMVTAVINGVDPLVPVRPVHARHGKWLRAEPVAALYEQGRVRHGGSLPALEDEMCDFGIGGLSSGRSPDRVDALVWCLTELLLSRRAQPRIRDFH